jgi:N-acetylmuramic acid 6-phosphate (MurNAc-6-P) etherase
VKTAIVMGRLSLDAQEARRRLDAAGGSVADIVGDLPTA